MLAWALTGADFCSLLNPFFCFLFHSLPPAVSRAHVHVDYSRLEKCCRLNHRLQPTSSAPWPEILPRSASFLTIQSAPSFKRPRTSSNYRKRGGKTRLTPCVAQLAACSYSVGWYRLLGGTLQFMNLRGRWGGATEGGG